MQKNTLNAVAESARTSIGFQAFFKIISFLFNLVLLRYVDIKIYGVANVRLNLLYTTIVFLTREPFRKVCIDFKDAAYFQINNLVLLCIPIGVFISLLLSFVWISLLEIPDIQYYKEGVYFYCLSAIIELLSEPFYIYLQSHLYLKPKIYIESTTLFMKQMLLFIFVRFYPQFQLYCFIYSQLFYTLLITLMYIYYYLYYIHSNPDPFYTSILSLFPHIEKNKPIFSTKHTPLILSFCKQSLIKQMLTESEKFVMTFLNILSFQEQGLYEAINNIGSLVIRLLFLPLEDAFYLYFSKEFSEEKKKDIKQETMMIPFILLKFLFYIGITFIVFGYWYSPILLYIFGGKNLSTPAGITLMRGCCFYVFIVGMNGISEAFFMATSEKKKIDNFNYYLIFISVTFLICSSFLTYPYNNKYYNLYYNLYNKYNNLYNKYNNLYNKYNNLYNNNNYILSTLSLSVFNKNSRGYLNVYTHYYGALGLILSNSISMGIRILHHLYYLYLYSSSFNINYEQYFEPVLLVIAAYIVAYVITKASYTLFGTLTLKNMIYHIAIGGLCFIGCIVAIFMFDADFMTQFSLILGLRRTKRNNNQSTKDKND
ncbi:hypothetical protein WA158_004846 [Blastocystis sp. Blastoise]